MADDGVAAGDPGALYVVATPIGNLEDLGGRAARVLADVDLVLAEDTRHTRRLFDRHGITTSMSALHEHNEARRAQQLADRVAGGERIALVSDAGTPLVSDPGFRLVRALRARDLPVLAIPGPCAATAALSVAGLPTDRFVFEGFLPARGSERGRRLQRIAREPGTVVLYEAPHRVVATLGDLVAVVGGGREAVLARELTKIHEQVRHGTLATLHREVSAREGRPRGEFVILVAGVAGDQAAPATIDSRRVLEALLDELPPRRAVDVAVRITGERRNHLYRLAMALRADAAEGAGADL